MAESDNFYIYWPGKEETLLILRLNPGGLERSWEEVAISMNTLYPPVNDHVRFTASKCTQHFNQMKKINPLFNTIVYNIRNMVQPLTLVIIPNLDEVPQQQSLEIRPHLEDVSQLQPLKIIPDLDEVPQQPPLEIRPNLEDVSQLQQLEIRPNLEDVSQLQPDIDSNLDEISQAHNDLNLVVSNHEMCKDGLCHKFCHANGYKILYCAKCGLIIRFTD